MSKSSIDNNTLLFFKEDILKDLRKFESEMTLKYNSELNKNTNKILKFQETLEEFSKKIEKISSLIKTDLNLEEKTNNLSSLFSTMEQELISHGVKINNTSNKLTETINKFNNELYISVIYPTVIGPKGKFKTFHEFMDYIILNVNSLLIFKEKLYTEFKEFKSKTDINMNNIQVRFDYQTKNCNAFTSASIRESEKKTGIILTNELDNINKKFDILSPAQEERIIYLINNCDKIKKLEEKIENNGNKKESLFKRANRFEKINNYNNSGLKKASSIVKQYIEGKLKDDELLFKRRRSLEKNISKVRDNIADKMEFSPEHNSHNNTKIYSRTKNSNSSKIIRKGNSANSEANIIDMNDSESSFNDHYGNKIEMDMQRNRIKNKINDIIINNTELFKGDNKYQTSTKDKNNYILSYLNKIYQDSEISNNNEEKLKINTIQKVQNINENNENLYITNNEKKESISLRFPNKQRRLSIRKLECIKVNNQNEPEKFNPIKNNDNVGIKELIYKIKQNSRESLLPNRTVYELEGQNHKNYINQKQKILNKNPKNLISLAYKPASRNKTKFNSELNIFNYQKKYESQNFSFNKQNLMNKSEIKKIDINFSAFQENNKDKEEEKMKKIFNQIENVIQEDEKMAIKNRFVKYGYNKDIIFAKNKKKYK